MERFDPYAIKCPSLELSPEENSRLPAIEKMRRVSEAFVYVQEKYREYVRQRDPNATENDILLEWLRLKGNLSEQFLVGLMLSRPDRFIDKPIFVQA